MVRQSKLDGPLKNIVKEGSRYVINSQNVCPDIYFIQVRCFQQDHVSHGKKLANSQLMSFGSLAELPVNQRMSGISFIVALVDTLGVMVQ